MLSPLVLSQPTITRSAEEAKTRALAYEQKIARASEPTGVADEAKAQADTKPQDQAAVPADAAPAPASPAPGPQAAPVEQDANPAMPEDALAALPPDDGGVNDPDALPWQHGRNPASPESGPTAAYPDHAYPDQAYPDQGYPDQYDDQADPMTAYPGEEADPNAWPAGPQDEPQEWVQVLVSGAGMHGAATEESPALFAFPSGRTLRVVSRYEGWVEVTDPQSAATGWMKAQYLAPVAAPGTRQEYEARYEDEPRRWRRRWLRRHGGALGDLLGRAIGDY